MGRCTFPGCFQPKTPATASPPPPMHLHRGRHGQASGHEHLLKRNHHARVLQLQEAELQRGPQACAGGQGEGSGREALEGMGWAALHAAAAGSDAGTPECHVPPPSSKPTCQEQREPVEQKGEQRECHGRVALEQ